MFFLIRHGERGDEGSPEEEAKVQIEADVHLTEIGHQQAYQTGQELSRLFSKLKEDNKIDQDAELCFVSSPMYRCLQTTKMLIMGAEHHPKNGTLYIESGIEEYFNSVCKGIDETWKEKVQFYNLDKYPQFVEEVLTKYPYKHNTLFDYENRQDLNTKFGENVEAAFQRFQAVFDNVGDLYNKNPGFNPRKTVFVLCSHGLSMMVIYHCLFGKELFGNYGYCNINLFELKKENEDDDHYKVDVKIENLQAFDI